MAKILITGWQVGLQKISMTKLVQSYTSMGLRDAKSVTDRVLNGEIVALTDVSDEEAERFVWLLKEVGANAEIARE